MNDELRLHIPTLEELWYRRGLLQDPDTMSYNKGCELNFDGYDNDTGCIDFPERKWAEWYAYFVGQEQRYYAYIARRSDDAFIGEVNLHKNQNAEWFDMGIVIEAKYRGNGYAERALGLLLRQAFEHMGAEAVHNDFEAERAAALKAHLSAGFTVIGQENGIAELSISRERYFRGKAVRKMVSAIVDILAQNQPSIYLYGSCVLNDFRLGWSDIDIVVLTQERISAEQARELVGLRQKMLEAESDNPYYRLFEGAMLPLSAFVSGNPDCVVYWGTSGERITDTYSFDSFNMTLLLQSGRMLYGQDIRCQLEMPSRKALCSDVRTHYESIRQYARTTRRGIHSFGWLLDIARGLYTLRTNTVASKTEAARWVLENGLCPVSEALETALKVRLDPIKSQNDVNVLNYSETLGREIQSFADVLGEELKTTEI